MGAAIKEIPSLEQSEQPRPPKRIRARKLFEPELVKIALKQSVVMLRPDIQWSNPVMFVVEIGAVLTLLFIFQAVISTSASQVPITYFIGLDFWLFFDCPLRKFCNRVGRGTRQGA